LGAMNKQERQTHFEVIARPNSKLREITYFYPMREFTHDQAASRT
jgi:hypothetical protein